MGDIAKIPYTLPPVRNVSPVVGDGDGKVAHDAPPTARIGYREETYDPPLLDIKFVVPPPDSNSKRDDASSSEETSSTRESEAPSHCTSCYVRLAIGSGGFGISVAGIVLMITGASFFGGLAMMIGGIVVMIGAGIGPYVVES